MSKQSAINYLERRKVELAEYMGNIECRKERINVFNKYIKMCEMVSILKEEKEW